MHWSYILAGIFCIVWAEFLQCDSLCTFTQTNVWVSGVSVGLLIIDRDTYLGLHWYWSSFRFLLTSISIQVNIEIVEVPVFFFLPLLQLKYATAKSSNSIIIKFFGVCSAKADIVLIQQIGDLYEWSWPYCTFTFWTIVQYQLGETSPNVYTG